MTRVLIADDDALMRAGLAAVLSSDPSVEVVGEASTGREAIALARRRLPDVILMDVRMPDLDGVAATRELSATLPSARVLILTTFEEDDYIFGGLRAGASGFLLKRTRPEELIAAVRTIAAGESLLSPSVTRRVIDRMAEQPDTGIAAAELDELTPRELDVLELLTRGLSNAEIADALVVESSTVNSGRACVEPAPNEACILRQSGVPGEACRAAHDMRAQDGKPPVRGWICRVLHAEDLAGGLHPLPCRRHDRRGRPRAAHRDRHPLRDGAARGRLAAGAG